MIKDEYGMQRRVAGYHDIRIDGMTDLLIRSRDAALLDVGCNRGMVSFEFANNGASVIHGCDIYSDGIKAARNTFELMNESRDLLSLECAKTSQNFDRHRYADLRAIESQFEVIDLTKGPSVLEVFGRSEYDIIVMLATYHKLKRVMSKEALSELMVHFGKSTKQYFAWRATSDKTQENEQELESLDVDLGIAGLQRIQTSYISQSLGVAAIWGRV